MTQRKELTNSNFDLLLLPFEILILIVKFLPLPNAIALLRVCKQLNINFSTSKSYWRSALLKVLDKSKIERIKSNQNDYLPYKNQLISFFRLPKQEQIKDLFPQESDFLDLIINKLNKNKNQKKIVTAILTDMPHELLSTSNKTFSPFSSNFYKLVSARKIEEYIFGLNNNVSLNNNIKSILPELWNTDVTQLVKLITIAISVKADKSFETFLYLIILLFNESVEKLRDYYNEVANIIFNCNDDYYVKVYALYILTCVKETEEKIRFLENYPDIHRACLEEALNQLSDAKQVVHILAEIFNSKITEHMSGKELNTDSKLSTTLTQLQLKNTVLMEYIKLNFEKCSLIKNQTNLRIKLNEQARQFQAVLEKAASSVQTSAVIGKTFKWVEKQYSGIQKLTEELTKELITINGEIVKLDKKISELMLDDISNEADIQLISLKPLKSGI